MDESGGYAVFTLLAGGNSTDDRQCYDNNTQHENISHHSKQYLHLNRKHHRPSHSRLFLIPTILVSSQFCIHPSQGSKLGSADHPSHHNFTSITFFPLAYHSRNISKSLFLNTYSSVPCLATHTPTKLPFEEAFVPKHNDHQLKE